MLVAAGAASATTAATTATALRPAIVSRTRRALGVASGPGRGANLGASFGHSCATGFGGQCRFRFGLRFIELGFVFRFFVHFVGRRDVYFFRGNRFPGKRYSVTRRRGFRGGCDFLRRLFMCVFVLTGRVGFFFEFLEGGIFFQFLDVVSKIRFFLFDLFFFDCTWGSSGRRRFRMLGGDGQAAVGFVAAFFVVLFCRFTAEYCSHVHLVQALLFAVPGARCIVTRSFVRLCSHFVDLRQCFRRSRQDRSGSSSTSEDRLVVGENLRERRSWTFEDRPFTYWRRPGLGQPLILGDGFSGQNDGLISRRRAVFGTLGPFRSRGPF